MLEKLYSYKAKYENEVKELENALVLAKAKVSVVEDMISDTEPQDEPSNEIATTDRTF
jgi:hypothetical protein